LLILTKRETRRLRRPKRRPTSWQTAEVSFESAMKIESYKRSDHISLLLLPSRYRCCHRHSGDALVRIVSMRMTFRPSQRLIIFSCLVWMADGRELVKWIWGHAFRANRRGHIEALMRTSCDSLILWMDKQQTQICILGCDIEKRQKFVWDCPDVVLIDQITLAELGRRDPHTNMFLIVLTVINCRGGTLVRGCAGGLRSCCNDRIEFCGCFCCLHWDKSPFTMK
jgi:hypothetical protein